VDILRSQLRERNSLLIAKKKRLIKLQKSREEVTYSKDRALKSNLSSQIHKLRNNIKRSEKKCENLRRLISVEQNKLVKNQFRGLRSQFKRTKRRKEKVISELEETRMKWQKISPEVTRLMSLEKDIKENIRNLEGQMRLKADAFRESLEIKKLKEIENVKKRIKKV